jgi:hypothetical protein
MWGDLDDPGVAWILKDSPFLDLLFVGLPMRFLGRRFFEHFVCTNLLSLVAL